MMDLQRNEMTLEGLAKIQRCLRLGKGYVSRDHETRTRDASELLILEAFDKLNCEGSYSIGGTSTESRSDFWFHFTTSCYGNTNLLNLFVRVCCPGRYRIKYVSDRKIKLRGDPGRDTFLTVGYGDLEERSINTTQDNEQVYLKTYEFKQSEKITKYHQSLVIPIGIKETAPSRPVNHEIRRLLETRLEAADFTIISKTNVKHRIHSIALEEHSPVVLKKQVCRALDDSQTSLYLDINDHEIIALTEFIYLYDIRSNYDFLDIVKLVAKFGLTKLYDWVEYNIRHYICYTNAYEIAKLAGNNDWKDILEVLFEYINASPEIFYTFGETDEVDRIILKEFLHFTYGGQNGYSALYAPFPVTQGRLPKPRRTT